MSIFDRIRGLFGGASENGEGGDGSRAAGRGPDSDEMIPCEEALRLVHEYLDGELDGVPHKQVKRHFDVCGRCYPHLKLETSYREAVRRASAGEEAPPELKAKVARLLAEAQAED